MRISDWSSDVCSSDLVELGGESAAPADQRVDLRDLHAAHDGQPVGRQHAQLLAGVAVLAVDGRPAERGKEARAIVGRLDPAPPEVRPWQVGGVRGAVRVARDGDWKGGGGGKE